MGHSVPVLRVEEWPITGQSLTGDNVRALIDRVNSSARGGVRFVGSVLQPAGGGGSNDRMPSPRRGCRSLPRTPPCTPPGDGDRDLEEHSPTYSPGEILFFLSLLVPGLVFSPFLSSSRLSFPPLFCSLLASAPRLPLSHDFEGRQCETSSLLSSVSSPEQG